MVEPKRLGEDLRLGKRGELADVHTLAPHRIPPFWGNRHLEHASLPFTQPAGIYFASVHAFPSDLLTPVGRLALAGLA